MTANAIEDSPREEPFTKSVYRFKVWNELENRDLVRFPRPCKGRIPNFVDCTIAAEKLSSLDVFKKAEVVMVNMDVAQEPVRFAALEAGKTLLVPNTRHPEGILTKMCIPIDAKRHVLKNACKRRGISYYGKPVTLNDKIHIDLIVMGSVAVSKEGHRIGKGGGYSDLEYAILAAIGAVTEDTTIVTTVHDVQVFDTLPHELFKPFDIPVDVIVTPTTVTEVTPPLPRIEKILWDFISNKKLEQVPLLKTLYDKEKENGKEYVLKESDSEQEDRPRPYYRPRFPQRRPQYQRPRRESFRSPSDSRKDSVVRDQSRRTRTFRRRRQENGDTVVSNGQREQKANKGINAGDKKIDEENKENQNQKPYRRQRRFARNRIQVDFSVKVGNIRSAMRVRDLKAALIEKGVRPREITWKGPRGFALLHFAKMNAQPEQPTAVDDVIASLQGLKVKFESKAEVKEALLSVEPAKPISRIENAGVTSV